LIPSCPQRPVRHLRRRRLTPDRHEQIHAASVFQQVHYRRRAAPPTATNQKISARQSGSRSATLIWPPKTTEVILSTIFRAMSDFEVARCDGRRRWVGLRNLASQVSHDDNGVTCRDVVGCGQQSQVLLHCQLSQVLDSQNVRPVDEFGPISLLKL
jgi:hypothetical protein